MSWDTPALSESTEQQRRDALLSVLLVTRELRADASPDVIFLYDAACNSLTRIIAQLQQTEPLAFANEDEM